MHRGHPRVIPDHMASDSQTGFAHQQQHKPVGMGSVRRTERDTLMPAWSPNLSRIAPDIGFGHIVLAKQETETQGTGHSVWWSCSLARCALHSTDKCNQ